MATEEMYERIKNLTRAEIVNVAAHCCGDIGCTEYDSKIKLALSRYSGVCDIECDSETEDENFCENECPYLDVREGEHNPHRFCRQWVMHDLLKLLEQES